MNKRKKLTLIIGFTIILITFVIIFASFVYYYVETKEPENPYLDEQRFLYPVYFFLMLPIILHELSLLRSVHKLINFTPGTVAKICLVVSVVISTVVLAFYLLSYAGIITKEEIFTKSSTPGNDFVLLWGFLGWPLFWVSFAFGSAICSRKEPQNDS